MIGLFYQTKKLELFFFFLRKVPHLQSGERLPFCVIPMPPNYQGIGGSLSMFTWRVTRVYKISKYKFG